MLDMKHIVYLGNNRYVHLDSYGESPKTRAVSQVMVVAFALVIACITVPALVGIDITNINSTQNHDNIKR
jgi:hypothetical protein